MIAKLCTWGKTREIAINRMESALDNFSLEGIDHNIPFLSAIVGSNRFKSGDLTTSFIDDEYQEALYHHDQQRIVLNDIFTAWGEVFGKANTTKFNLSKSKNEKRNI